MNYTKAIGFGVLLWAVMFALTAIFAPWYMALVWVKVLIAIAAGIVSYILATYTEVPTSGRALEYGLSWVVVAGVLDALITMRFVPGLFSIWSLWAGYALVLLAPLLHVRHVHRTV